MRRYSLGPIFLLTALALTACSGDGGTPPGATTGSITGRVTEGSNNVPSAQIGLAGAASRSATTNTSGAYTFADLIPGNYTVTVTPPQGFRLRSGDNQTKSASVAAGQTATVDWNLDRDSGGQVEEIRLLATSFDRPDITIARGTTVRWVNNGGTHTVTPDGHTQWQRAVTSEAGEVLRHTFNEAGTFPYYCEPHRAVGMTGVIRVQ